MPVHFDESSIDLHVPDAMAHLCLTFSLYLFAGFWPVIAVFHWIFGTRDKDKEIETFEIYFEFEKGNFRENKNIGYYTYSSDLRRAVAGLLKIDGLASSVS